MKHVKQKGFTIIELIVSLGVLGILAAIAFPAYQNYVRRTYYSEVVQATVPLKVRVIECYHTLKTLKGCSSGEQHIPPAITSPTGSIQSLIVAHGVITTIPVEKHGITKTDTYVLTPIIVNNALRWSISGGSVKNRLV